MSANGLAVFDRTIQTTNIWLDEVMEDLGEDRQVAWKVLGVVIRKLRDRLPVELAAHLGADLPLLIRGAYYDQFEPARQPTREHTFDQFCGEIAEHLRDTRPVDPGVVVLSVFGLLSRHLPEGQIAKVQEALPHDIRRAWPTAEARMERRLRGGERMEDRWPPRV
jgi:uncharacterized protein (DUF2267 family)